MVRVMPENDNTVRLEYTSQFTGRPALSSVATAVLLTRISAVISIFRSGTDLLLLLILFFLLFLLGRPFKKSKAPPNLMRPAPQIRWFSSDIARSINLLTYLLTFKMAAMTSFHVEKCCHVMSSHAASARRLCSSVRPFLINCKFCNLFINGPVFRDSSQVKFWDLG